MQFVRFFFPLVNALYMHTNDSYTHAWKQVYIYMGEQNEYRDKITWDSIKYKHPFSRHQLSPRDNYLETKLLRIGAKKQNKTKKKKTITS